MTGPNRSSAVMQRSEPQDYEYDHGLDGDLCDCHGETWDMCPNNFDCGMLADGTCMLAGTEDCDWECPFH